MANKSFKATLQGTIHQKNSRWWWKTKLPGETKAKDRALKPNGAQCATKDAKKAEKIAREIWENAITAEAEARIRAEMAEEINKKKAEFKEKLEAYAQTVEKVKAEAEERAKAEAEPEAKATPEAEPELAETTSNTITTATCECCGKQDVPENDLARIDSGQQLCPDCLKMLRQ